MAGALHLNFVAARVNTCHPAGSSSRCKLLNNGIRKMPVVVRCMSPKENPEVAADGVKPAAGKPDQTAAKSETVLPQAAAAAATEKQKSSDNNSFTNLFAFSGPVPEAVNGRLAMVGFAAALGMELASGRDLAAQLENGGVSWFTAMALLFTMASLIPLSQGVSVDKASGGIGGIFTAKAERWNGRAAMLGLVALAMTEFVKGSPLV